MKTLQRLGILTMASLACACGPSSGARAAEVTIAEPVELPKPVDAPKEVPKEKDDDFESPPVVDAKSVAPAEVANSATFALAPKAEVQGYFMRFHLSSERFGEFEASSLDQLKVRAHEIDVLALVNDTPEENGFTKGAKEKFKGTGLAIKDTVVTPAETFKAVGKGISGTAQSAFDFVRGKDRHQPKESLLLAEQKRKLAAKWGVDIYTSNLQIQDLLTRKSKLRAVGDGVVSLSMSAGASFLTPVSVALSTVSYRENMASKFEMYSTAELYRYNDGILKKMGVQSDDREAFLFDDKMSPKQKTEIIADMVTLDQLSDKTGFLKLLTEPHPADGVWQVQAVDMLAKRYDAADPITRVSSRGPALAAYTVSGKTIIVIPADLLFWSKEIAQVFESSEKIQPGQAECLTPGKMTSYAKKEIERLGYSVREQFLIETK